MMRQITDSLLAARAHALSVALTGTHPGDRFGTTHPVLNYNPGELDSARWSATVSSRPRGTKGRWTKYYGTTPFEALGGLVKTLRLECESFGKDPDVILREAGVA